MVINGWARPAMSTCRSFIFLSCLSGAAIDARQVDEDDHDGLILLGFKCMV
jgi:hypothetical protein